MSTINRYVNTASAGGDGTTNNLSGADAAFASVENFVVDCNANKVQADIWICHCSGGQDNMPTTPTVLSAATEAGGYILFQPNSSDSQQHVGVFDASKYYLYNDSYNWVLKTSSVYVRFIGMQFKNVGNTTYGSATVWCTANPCTPSFERCIFWHAYSGTGADATSHDIFATYATNASVHSNIFIHDDKNAGDACLRMEGEGSGNRIYNNTFIDATAAISSWGNALICKNNLFSGCTSIGIADAQTFHTSSNYNATDLAVAPLNFGANSLTSQTFSFVNTAIDDYHLAAAVDGVDASSDYTPASSWNDIDNVARSGTWSIGADQFIGSGIERSIAEHVSHGSF